MGRTKMCRTDYTCDATDYIGLSTETKETEGICNGSSYLEVDTATIYIFYKGTWYPQNKEG